MESITNKYSNKLLKILNTLMNTVMNFGMLVNYKKYWNIKNGEILKK